MLPVAELAVCGALGYGLYLVYSSDPFTDLQKYLDHYQKRTINTGNVHEAMGPTFTGKKAIRLYGRHDAVHLRMQRKRLETIRANQSPGDLLEDIQKVSAASLLDVKDKTAFIFNQGKNRYLQGRTTEKFQQASVL